MQLQQVDIPPGRLLSLGPRPAAVARGRRRVDLGPVPVDVLAEAIADAHALLREGATGRPTLLR